MGEALRVTPEVGRRGKQVVAVAPDWPGRERGAKTGVAAIERLVSYLPRYALLAARARLGTEFSGVSDVPVFEEYAGVDSTDFWGISCAFSGVDRQEQTSGELDRELTLMRACRSYFDEIRSRVSSELRKGPRGGGCDRDQIVRHTFGAELDRAKKRGVASPTDRLRTDERLRAYRDAYCGAIREFHAQGRPARTWPLRYLIRHTVCHTLDHAWEMEDKDLTDVPA